MNTLPRSAIAALVAAALTGPALAQRGGDLNNQQNSPHFNGGATSRSLPGSNPSSANYITPRPMVIPSSPRQNFAGIGQGRAHIDLLSNPARTQNFATVEPLPLTTPTLVRTPTAAEAFVAGDRNNHIIAAAPAVLFNDRAFVEGSSMFVNGDWRSRHWNVHFGLGADPIFVSRLGAPAVSWDPNYGGYVYGYGNPYYPPPTYGYPFGPYASTMPEAFPAYEGPMNEQPANGQPAANQTQQPMTDLDIALYEIRTGQVDAATAQLRKYLKDHPDDAHAMRMLSIALLQGKHFDDASAMFRQAYRTDPGLAGEPIDAQNLGIDGSDLRRMVNSSVLYAHRVNSGSSWLAVAALMQAEGRAAPARDMLLRAEKQGLESAVLVPMKAALQ